MRIANRMFLWFALLTMFVALSVFSCLYFAVRPSLQRTAYGALEGIAQSDLRAVDQAIASANAVSVNTTYSAGIRGAMAKLNHRGALTHTELIEAAEQLVAVNGTMFPVIQIRLYPESGLMLASGMVNGQYVFSRSTLPWYAEVMAADGSKVISAPYRDESLSKRGYVIALRRAFKQNFRQALGVVEVVLDAQSAFGALYAEDAASTYLLDGNGGVLFPIGSALDEDVIQRVLDGTGQGIAEAVKGETPVLAAWRKSDITGWTIVSVRARSEVLRPLTQMMVLTLGITAALLFAALIFAYILSRQITRPIGQLATRMRAFALGRSEVPPAKASEFDELAALDGAFENLKTDLSHSVHDLLQMRERELESRMMALQSQMNPHFLHNALGNLQALIEMGDAPRAARMIDGMSRMLRYIASDENPMVPLADEMRHAEDYMALMRLRFGEKLRFELDRGELPGDLAVPKLSIQPLLENAVKYGCNGRPPWRVKLTLTAYRDGWRADVTDDGPGFDQKTLDKLMEGVERIRRTGVLPSLKIDGMGLLNIAMRLNLYQSGDFLFHIQNLDGGGCVVSIGSPERAKGRAMKMDEHSYRIVLCEDEPLLLTRLRRMVEGLDSGFTVVGMVENGREALEVLNDTGADLLITDIRMPVMDGIELIKKLQEEQPRLECMLISGYGDFEYARTALRLGVCEYLLKPVSEEELKMALQRIRERLGERRGQLKTEMTPPPEASADDVIEQLGAYIREHAFEEIHFLELIARTNYHPNYVSRLFSKRFGAPPQRYQIVQRMNEAKRLLMLLPEEPVRRIGLKVGYPDQNYFARVFRQTTGVSPQRFRRDHGGNQ